MYHVVLGIAPDDDQIRDKVSAITDIPQAPESVRVTLVHFHEGDSPVEEVPTVAEAMDLLEAADIESEVYNSNRDDAASGLIEAAEELQADVLCIGGRHRSPAGKLQMKTGSRKVVLQAECPVLVAGDIESREPRA